MEAFDENKHVCPYSECCKPFPDAVHLVSHLQDHKEEMPYRCQHEGCTRQYKRSDHLDRHVRETHAGDSELWRCYESDCDKVFKNKQNLKKHILRKHTADRFKCKVIGCGQVFKKHHQLKAHSVDHNQELPYRCKAPDCEKAFPVLSKLLRHAKMHEGYYCKQEGCEARFEKWTLLLKHRKLQHGTEYICEVCQKLFRQKNRLKRHLMTHTDNRTMFVCEYEGCDREYTQNRNLQSHIRSYHEGGRWHCEHEDCSQTFSTKQKMQLHMDLHDPKKPPKKKKPRKKKSHAENITGVSIETESRGEDSMLAMKSPEPDSIELSDLDKKSSLKEATLSLPTLMGTFDRKRKAAETEVCSHSSENEDNSDQDEDFTENESKKRRIDFEKSASADEICKHKQGIICDTSENMNSVDVDSHLSEKAGAKSKNDFDTVETESCNEIKTVTTEEKDDIKSCSVSLNVESGDSVIKSKVISASASVKDVTDKFVSENVDTALSAGNRTEEEVSDSHKITVHVEVYSQ